MSKLGRNYKLLIQDRFITTSALGPVSTQSTTALEIDYPLSITFNVQRAIGGIYENTMDIEIYNLSPSSRAKLVKDAFNIDIFPNSNPDGLTNGVPQYRQIWLSAGYGKNILPIFVGTILEAYSKRVGVDMITHIHAVSGAFGMFNSFINQTYGAGTPYQSIVNDIVNRLVKSGSIQEGAIAPVDGTAINGYTAFGDSFDILTEFGQVNIDLNKINILQANNIINTSLGGVNNIYLISSDTGLLGTPVRRETYVDVDMIFEPAIQLAQLIQIQSTTDKRFNGQYKVMGINHKGIISGAVNGELTTTLKLWIGENLINGFSKIK